MNQILIKKMCHIGHCFYPIDTKFTRLLFAGLHLLAPLPLSLSYLPFILYISFVNDTKYFRGTLHMVQSNHSLYPTMGNNHLRSREQLCHTWTTQWQPKITLMHIQQIRCDRGCIFKHHCKQLINSLKRAALYSIITALPETPYGSQY